MAHLWLHQQSQKPPWAILLLDEYSKVFLVGDAGNTPRIVCNPANSDSLFGCLIRQSGPGGKDWWVFAATVDSPVYVNGVLLSLGLRVLRDRDEIRIGLSTPLFFSYESLAQIESFPGGPKPTKCPRCQQEIASDTPAVRCPQCSIWYHQNPKTELPCWTYSKTCAKCTQVTQIEAGYRWTPEGL